MPRTSEERFGFLLTSSTLQRSRGNTSRWTCGAMVAAETRSTRILAIGSLIGSLTILVLPMYGGAFGRTGCTSATPKHSRNISSPRRRDRLDLMRNMSCTCTSHTLNGRHRPGLGVGAKPRGGRRCVSASRKRTRAIHIAGCELPGINLLKLSEKSQTGLQCSPTDRRKGASQTHFALRIAANSTVGALLVHLFGRFL